MGEAPLLLVFIMIESLQKPTDRQGGMHICDNTNVDCEDIDIYNYALIWGRPLYGDYRFVRVRSVYSLST